MSVNQVFNQTVNRVFILGEIKDIQVVQTDQTPMNYLIVETREDWTGKVGKEKTSIEQYYVVLPKKFNEYLDNLQLNQSILIQGCLKAKHQNQYSQIKCENYIYAESIKDIETLTDLKEMKVNDGLPFPKHFISLWFDSKAH